MKGFPRSSGDKESACNAGDPGSILGLGRSPGDGNGYPRQYSCLENPMDREAWWATVPGVTKTQRHEVNCAELCDLLSLTSPEHGAVGTFRLWPAVRSTGDHLHLWLASQVGPVLQDWALNLWNLMLSPGRKYQNGVKLSPRWVAWELLAVGENREAFLGSEVLWGGSGESKGQRGFAWRSSGEDSEPPTQGCRGCGFEPWLGN